MALESLPKIAPALFSADQDLIQIYNKKTDTLGVINPSYIKSSPSGVAGAIQFSDGSAFASDASNLFWDNVNKRLGVGTNAPSNDLSVINSTSGSSSGIRGITVGNSNTANALNIGSFFNQGIITVQNGPLIIETFGSSKGVSISTGYLVPSAMTHIQGSGSTSATTSLLVQNSAGADLFKVFDNGQIYVPQPSGQTMFIDTIKGYANSFIGCRSGFSCGADIPSIVASAALQVNSINQGFLPPRLSSTQKLAIASPAAGLQVYDSTLNQMSYYNGTTWVNF